MPCPRARISATSHSGGRQFSKSFGRSRAAPMPRGSPPDKAGGCRYHWACESVPLAGPSRQREPILSWT
eukprot:9087310-Lingulodinium_polyedra.AAC.1